MKQYVLMVGILSAISFSLQADITLDTLLGIKSELDNKKLNLQDLLANAQQELDLETKLSKQYNKNDPFEAFHISYQKLYISVWQSTVKKYKRKISILTSREARLLIKITQLSVEQEEKEIAQEKKVAQKRSFISRTLARLRSSSTVSAIDLFNKENQDRRHSTS